MEIKEQTIVILGATGGIGSHIARHLHDEGANLILISKSDEKLKRLNGELNNKHAYYVCDLTKRTEIKNSIFQIKKIHNKILGLINAAGIGVYKKIDEVSDEDWEYSHKLNVSAPFYFIRDLLPILKETDNSFVLTIGSGAGTIPMRGRTVYCSNKFALRGLILSLAEELKGSVPKICLLTLGSTITNFGNMTIEQKIERNKKGDAYFTVEWVANKVMEIIKSNEKETEIVLFPGDYGFGTWRKP